MKSPIGSIEDARGYERQEDKRQEVDTEKVCFAPDDVPDSCHRSGREAWLGIRGLDLGLVGMGGRGHLPRGVGGTKAERPNSRPMMLNS